MFFKAWKVFPCGWGLPLIAITFLCFLFLIVVLFDEYF